MNYTTVPVRSISKSKHDGENMTIDLKSATSSCPKSTPYDTKILLDSVIDLVDRLVIWSISNLIKA